MAAVPPFDELAPSDRRDVLFEVRDGCWCHLAREFWDEQATRYANTHLEEVGSQADGWETVYRCPRSGARWLLDKPLSEEHGGGPTRLRRI